MTNETSGRNLDYYRQREQQERAQAARARDKIARRVHLEMAERYSTLATTLTPSGAQA
jgi:hypothetical protein